MIRIFIELKQKGNFASCEGCYSIVLETTLNETIYTRTHYGAWKGTTPQRLQLHALLDALEHIKVDKQEVEVHINSQYIAASIEREPKKNLDLWQQLKEKSKGHQIAIVSERTNEYSPAMVLELSTRKIEIKEDNYGNKK